MNTQNDNNSSKVAFSLSSKKNKRKALSLAPSNDFHHDLETATSAEPLHHHTEPLVIPLLESERKSLLKRKREEKQQPSQDELAAQALTLQAQQHLADKQSSSKASGTNFEAQGDFVISSGQNTKLILQDKEKRQLERDVDALPDEADDQAYQRVPIHEFGAALLRGMGWTGNDSSDSAPAQPTMRPHRLGLGATPKLVTSGKKLRTADQVKRDERLEQQHEDYERQRQERIQKDKQQTLQIGSIVLNEGSYAKLHQLTGVPGLNRVLVQFEGHDTTTSVKKGDIFLVSREELSRRPFHDVPLVEDTRNAKTKYMGLEQQSDKHGDKEKRRRDDNDRHDDKKRRKEEHHSHKTRHKDKDHGTWLIPNIRVRVITKKFGSQHYKEKAVVEDVTHRGEATLRFQGNQVLDGVSEKYLETALPKAGGNAIVLVGKSKHAKGKLLERDSRSGKGVIQVFEDMSVVTLSLDDMAEWVGPLDDDMME